MTIIKPNSIAGITSITAQGDVINLYKSDGTLAGLQLNGVNFNTTSGVSTFNNVTVGGTITYQDVSHVDSVGIITAQQGLQVLANGLNVTGVSTFSDDVSISDKIIHTGDTNTAIRFPANDQISFEVGGVERLRVHSNNYVGINSSIPLRPLDVTAPLGINIPLVITSGSNQTNGFIAIKDPNTTGNFNNRIGCEGDNLLFWTNAAERFRITSTGDVVLGQGSTVGSSVGVVTYYGDGSQLSGISVGLTTESASPNNTITHLDLTNAQDHKLIVSGITTISVTGGTEADSHTIRIQNSGISTVGFSTYFLFPSGAAPTLPTADGAISLISFTVHRVGAAGTQLLAGASVNYN